MTRHPNYYPSDLRGQTIYRCCQCQHDTFEENRAIFHAQVDHKPVMVADESDSHCLIQSYNMPRLKITMGILTSPSDDYAVPLRHFAKEVARLQAAGAQVNAIWIDNGSHIANESGYHNIELQHFRVNLGQSIARNVMIDRACSENADYLFMVDGDISVIPYSTFAMAHYLGTQRSNRVGCIGMYSRNCTAHDDRLATDCYSLDTTPVLSPGIAWTQYGMFDVDLFRQGARFDISPCFQGQGWGFEDDDLYCQMLALKYRSANSKYFRYSHKTMHGGLRAMDQALAAKVFANRKSHVFNKWCNNQLTTAHVAAMVNQSMPVV